MSKIPKGAVVTHGLVKRQSEGSQPRPWPEGPWTDEPDKVTWQQGKLKCHIRRNPSVGNLCGYVHIPPDHGLHPTRTTRSWDYNDYYDIDVHGGWTYSDGGPTDSIDFMGASVGLGDAEQSEFVLGFDCAHSGDELPSMMAMTPSSLMSGNSYKTIDYVVTSLLEICDQIENLVSKGSP